MGNNEKQYNNEQSVVADDVKKFAALEALTHSDGGKILIEALKTDVLDALDMVLLRYSDMDEIKLRSNIARLEERLKLLRTLTRSEKNVDLARKELERLLTE